MADLKEDTVVRRLYASGTWKLDSAAHFGSGDTGIADMSLLRDVDRKPFIFRGHLSLVHREAFSRDSVSRGRNTKKRMKTKHSNASSAEICGRIDLNQRKIRIR